MAEVSCPQCGHKNPLTAKFCSSCGASLDANSEEHHTTMSVTVPIDSPMEEIEIELDQLPPGIGMLVVTRGPNSGSRYALDEPLVTAGRHPDSVIFLDDITVSRRHAEVERTATGYVVRDAGSLNGTYLNAERIDDEVVLHQGDELQVGKFRLVFFERSDG